VIVVLFSWVRMAEEEWDFDSPKSSDKRSIKQKNKKKKQLLMEGDSKSDDDDASANKEKQKKKKDLFVEEQEVNRVSVPVEGNSEVNGKSADSRKDKMKKRKRKKLLEESAKTDKRGICYLSRIPPRMDFDYIRTHFSQYGEVERLYLAPQSKQSLENSNPLKLLYFFFPSMIFYTC
jgi:ESF2/ABP1 family protein